MKWIIGALCLTTILVAVSARTCKTEDDCKEGTCCVGKTMRQMSKKGLCLRLGRLGSKCSEPESKNDYFGGKFHSYCSCAEGLVCKPTREGITDPIARRDALRCQNPTGTTTGPDVVTDATAPTDENPQETDAPEEVIETDAPEEEIVETEAPEEETEAPEEEETEVPEEEVPEEAGQNGPGGDHPRPEDPDCEDWTYGC